jgi:hypothetical protein
VLALERIFRLVSFSASPRLSLRFRSKVAALP